MDEHLQMLGEYGESEEEDYQGAQSPRLEPKDMEEMTLNKLAREQDKAEWKI